MSQKLSAKKELLVLKLYLSGLSYGEIAAKAGVSKGTVANIVAGLKAGQFPEIGDVADQVELLRELAVDLKHAKLTLSQASVGVGVLNRLHEIGADPADMEKCAAVGHAVAGEDADMPSFIEAVLRFEEACKETGLDFEDLESKVKELAELADHLEPLAQKAAEYACELEELEERKEVLVGEVSRLEARHQELGNAVKEREEREGELCKRVIEVEGRAQVADEKLSHARAEITALSETGMSLDDLSGFTQRVCVIAHRHGIAPDDLSGKLLTELELLDAGLGLEAAEQAKQHELQEIGEKADAAEAKLSSLRGECQELECQKANLQAALEQARHHLTADMQSMGDVVQSTMGQARQVLSEGVVESLQEVARLRDQALELGQEMGRCEALLEANHWLGTLLALVKGDTGAEAAEIRGVGVMILRGMLDWIAAHGDVATSWSLLKMTLDSALREVEKWKP
jgi:DNA repair exonuclease SbcCD ATPase subunit